MMKDDYFVGWNALKSQFDLRSLDKKIDWYELRLNGWYIRIAKALENDPSDLLGGPGADPAALMIAMSLFEPHGVYLQGKNTPLNKYKEPQSKFNFEYGFRRFLSKKHAGWNQQKQDAIAEMVYTHVRCGFFHLNSHKKGIRYYRGETHPEPSINPKYYRKKLIRITFNVPAFVLEVEEYFHEYVAVLRNSKSQERKRFTEGWKIIDSSLS
jgi:hypothetical protein